MRVHLRSVVVVAAAGLSAVALAVPASAGVPVGACPTGTDLLLSTSDPRLAGISGNPSIDPNGDGFTCVRIISDSLQGNGRRAAIVDTASQAPTGLRPRVLPAGAASR